MKLLIFITVVLLIFFGIYNLWLKPAQGEEYTGDADRKSTTLEVTFDHYLSSMTVHHEWDGDQTDYTKGSWMTATVK